MSIFPMKILSATDGSEDANLALREAVDIAEKIGSELHVVHVGTPVCLPRYYEGLDMKEYIEEEEKELERRAQRLLADQVEKIKAAGGSVVQAHLRTGKPDEEIVALADELGAELIVMGSRGLGRVRRALMGSVSDSVVRHAYCPVMVVRREEHGEALSSSKRILLATDGSKDAELAARTSGGLAQKTGSELHAVYVRPRIIPHRPGYYVGPEVMEDAERKEREGLEQEAQRLLEAQVGEVREAGGNVARAHLRVGRPDEEIVDLAEELGVGLILMGSRGQGRIRRALLGSVSDSVVRHAHCPVMVVRQEKPREKAEPDRDEMLT